MSISIGIDKKDREAIAKHLSKLLADTYSLYLKTHSFHWNITGPQFNSLHAMFEVLRSGLLQPVRQAHLDQGGGWRTGMEGNGRPVGRRP